MLSNAHSWADFILKHMGLYIFIFHTMHTKLSPCLKSQSAGGRVLRVEGWINCKNGFNVSWHSSHNAMIRRCRGRRRKRLNVKQGHSTLHGANPQPYPHLVPAVRPTTTNNSLSDGRPQHTQYRGQFWWVFYSAEENAVNKIRLKLKGRQIGLKTSANT